MVGNIFGIWRQNLVSFGNPLAALIYHSVCGLDAWSVRPLHLDNHIICGDSSPFPLSTHPLPFPTASVYDVLQQLSMNSTAANKYNTCNTDQPTT